MIIRIQNVQKVAEDTLYLWLDYLYDQGQFDSTDYKIIDAELDRRARLFKENQRKEQEAKIKAQKQLEARIELYQNIVALNGDKVVMKAMVAEFGGDFESNYHIEANFLVKSSCFNPRNPNQQNTWQFDSLKDAQNKVFHLIYWRVYDKYFRNDPDEFSLRRLEAAILELKGR